MARTFFVLTIAIGAGWLGYTRLVRSDSDASGLGMAQPQAWPSDEPDVLFSAPGVTEPASRTIQVFSELPGTIGKMHVQSGDVIRQGQLLFELDNDTQIAEVRRWEAAVTRARAELAKLESWERPEDRQVARGQWDEAQALLERAEFEHRRREALVASAAVSDKEINDSRSDVAVARARAAVAKARYDRSESGPRPEDLTLARALVAEAESQLEVSRSVLDKTLIRSPIDGIVIYRFREPGESVFPNVPTPVLSIGNRDVLNIRADVDELDFSKVQVGQRVFAACDAFEGRRFYGRVVQVAQTLGRKNFRTDRPTERADTKILEVVIALDDGRDLPVELQMSVWFLKNTSGDRSLSRAGEHSPRPSTQPAGIKS